MARGRDEWAFGGRKPQREGKKGLEGLIECKWHSSERDTEIIFWQAKKETHSIRPPTFANAKRELSSPRGTRGCLWRRPVWSSNAEGHMGGGTSATSSSFESDLRPANARRCLAFV